MSNALTNMENKPSLRASHCKDEGRRNLKQSHPLVPELRFKGFEGDWTKEKAGELCDCIVPGRNKPKQFDGDIAWITTPDIVHNSYIFNSKSGLGISKEEAKSVGSKIAPKNSVIISCVGDLGLVAIAGIELVINQQLHAFLPSEKVEYRFLMYSITTQGRYIDRVATKTAVPYMNKNNCNSIPVHLPSLPEQQKIASFLSAVDEKIQQLTKKKALLEQYKKGVMQELFSYEKRLHKGELRKGNLGDFGFFYYGKGAPKTSIVEGAPTPCVRYGELYSTFKEEIKEIKSYTIVDPKDLKLSKGGEVLVPRVGEKPLEFANCSYLPFANVAIGEMISVYNTDEDGLFMTYYINARLQKQLARMVEGGNVSNLYFRYVAEIEVEIPCVEEQQKIIGFVSRIDTKIEAVNNQITQSQTFKKGLLQQMFV
jgi:type I restriction enzyme S subunit